MQLNSQLDLNCTASQMPSYIRLMQESSNSIKPPDLEETTKTTEDNLIRRLYLTFIQLDIALLSQQTI